MEEVLEIRRWSSYFQEKRLSITFVIAEDGGGIMDRARKKLRLNDIKDTMEIYVSFVN